MPKLMKPITFGCENGFQEVFYESEKPEDSGSYEEGKVFCYLHRLEEDEKSSEIVLKKCMAMKAGECWKENL